MSDIKPFDRGTKAQDHEGTNEAINPNLHIHLGSSIRIPKYFKLSKYFLKLLNG